MVLLVHLCFSNATICLSYYRKWEIIKLWGFHLLCVDFLALFCQQLTKKLLTITALVQPAIKIILCQKCSPVPEEFAVVVMVSGEVKPWEVDSDLRRLAALAWLRAVFVPPLVMIWMVFPLTWPVVPAPLPGGATARMMVIGELPVPSPVKHTLYHSNKISNVKGVVFVWVYVSADFHNHIKCTDCTLQSTCWCEKKLKIIVAYVYEWNYEYNGGYENTPRSAPSSMDAMQRARKMTVKNICLNSKLPWLLFIITLLFF